MMKSPIRMIGYCTDWSVAPGESVDFKVSCDGVDRYKAQIARVICADLDPLGPGYRHQIIADIEPSEIGGRFQPIYSGSYVRIEDATSLDGLQSFGLAALIWPTSPGNKRQAIIGRWDDVAVCGYLLEVDETGASSLRLGDGVGAPSVLSVDSKMQCRQWYFVGASFNAETGAVQVMQEALESFPGILDTSLCEGTFKTRRKIAATAPLLLAAFASDRAEGDWLAGGFFNGKIERPRIISGVTDPAALRRSVMAPDATELPESVVAAWDFAEGIGTDRITDLSRSRLDGKAVNTPPRAMAGHNWNSSTLDWRQSTEQYGAIHFHDDDIYDCAWKTDFSWTVPQDAKSGFYAAQLNTDDETEFVPFFVRPDPRKPRAKLAVIASTATYLAYANTHVKVDTVASEVMSETTNQLTHQDMYLLEHRELGHSTYDYHSDGSGVCFSSQRRPILTMRPGPYTFNYVNDTHVTAWLEQIGQDYDVITDEDIDREGVSILSEYVAIITLSHPEYTSTRMWNAIYDYQCSGGRHLYLGGNGFYWRVAFHPSFPGLLECRKDATGVRAWEGEPGEGHMEITGEPGGLWRTDGRAPQKLVGVGYSSTMFARSTYYKRTAESYDDRVAF